MKRSLMIFAGLCAVGVASGQMLDPASVVARVDGQAITASQFYSRMAYLDGVGVLEDGKFVAMPPALLTLRRMIDEMVVLMVARDKGVAPTPAEIQAEVAKRRAEKPESLKDLKDLGVSDEMIAGQIAQDLARFNLITMGITITDAQIQNHYDVNKLVYVVPAKTKLRVIVVEKAEDKAKVDDALKTKSFAEVARTMSIDLTKMIDGDLPEVNTESLPENVKAATANVAAGSATAWIESGGAFSKYLVERKSAQRQLPLDAALKQEIRERMMVIGGQQKNGLEVENLIRTKRRSLKVEISSPGLQKLWNLLSGG